MTSILKEGKGDPRLAIGGNFPPLPERISSETDLPTQVTAFLDEHHAALTTQVREILDEARELPKQINDDEEMGKAAKLVKRMRDLAKSIEAMHAKEKAPYLRSSQAIDNWFFGAWDKVARRSKTNKSGAADILQARIDDYNQRKLAVERERRRQEEERARREAEEARRIEEEARRKAEEDRLAAERARKPETIAAKEAVADLSERNAAEAAAEAEIALAKAQDARVATFDKAADVIRTRVEDGPTVTMKDEPYAIIVDYDLLDLEILRPFIKRDALDAALRAWAKTTNHNVQMIGAEIGRKARTVVR